MGIAVGIAEIASSSRIPEWSFASGHTAVEGKPAVAVLVAVLVAVFVAVAAVAAELGPAVADCTRQMQPG